MSRSKSKKAGKVGSGPAGYQEWLAANQGGEPLAMYEVQFYSDAHLIGACKPIERCPFVVLNAFPYLAIGTLAHVLTLRVCFYTQQRMPKWDKTDVTRYYGGRIEDEVAALMSLLLGVRLQAGGVTREFNHQDALGVPRGDTQVPASPLPTLHHHGRWRIPAARQQRNLGDYVHPLFDTYPSLTPSEAIALVRAARLYQRALWVSETTPELAWLHLVAAIEVLAVHEHCDTVDDAQLLAEVIPDLHETLNIHGGKALIDACAPLLSPMLESTKRFVGFLKAFGPLESPPARPKGAINIIAWELTELEVQYKRIYNCRSRALHSGEPFPAPMNEHAGDGPDYGETIHGSAQYTQDAVWLKRDVPMRLHVFEYVTRSALLLWWTRRADAHRMGQSGEEFVGAA